jgi:hypothetical protein
VRQRGAGKRKGNTYTYTYIYTVSSTGELELPVHKSGHPASNFEIAGQGWMIHLKEEKYRRKG